MINDLFPVIDWDIHNKGLSEFPLIHTVAREQRDATLSDMLRWLEQAAKTADIYRQDHPNSFTSGLYHGVQGMIIELRDMLKREGVR